MKKIFVILILFTLLITNVPSFAISSDTHVLPFIGPATERFKDKSVEVIGNAPLKLPEEVFKLDLTEAERAFVPNVLSDQVAFWSSPLRMKFRDLLWFLPAAGAITALLITDEDFSQALTNSNKPTSLQKDISGGLARLGGYEVSFGLPGLLLLSGLATKNDKLRETGVLQYHALANSFAIGMILQRIFGRGEPYKSEKAKGNFFAGKNSFPSGHALSAWTLATVVAHEYWDTKYKWAPILAYSLAVITAGARVTENKHYPADVFVSAVLGYVIGRYVVKHHSKFAPIVKEYTESAKSQGFDKINVPRDGSF